MGLPPKPVRGRLTWRTLTGRGRRLTAGAAADTGIPALDAIARRPRMAALIGAMCISFSGIFYQYADVSPSTGTFYRAVFGLPLLAPGRLGRAPALRSAAGSRTSIRDRRRRLLRGRPDVLASRDRIRRGGAGDRAGQPPGPRRGRRRVADLRGAAVPGDPPRGPRRACRRRADLRGRRGRGVRREPGARGRARARDRVVLLRVPAVDPDGRTRPAPAGRTGRDRHDRHGPRGRLVRVRHGGPRPDAGAGQPRLAGAARGDVAVDRLPVHLARPAAPAGGRHVDHPARPAAAHGAAERRAARRASVGGAAGRGGAGHRRDRGRDDPARAVAGRASQPRRDRAAVE